MVEKEEEREGEGEVVVVAERYIIWRGGWRCEECGGLEQQSKHDEERHNDARHHDRRRVEHQLSQLVVVDDLCSRGSRELR